MAVARVWNGSDWIPVAGGSGLDVPSNIASGHGVIYNGNGQWIPERLATQQALDDLRDEFDGDTRFLKAPATAAPSDGCVITSDIASQGGAKWHLPIPTVAFPSSPVDGQMFAYEPVSGITWLFRYNAGGSSPYFWEFAGGAPIVTLNESTVTTTSTSYVAPTGAMSITVPRAGIYMIEVSGYGYSSTVATNHLNYAINGTAQADEYGANSDGQQGNSVMRVRYNTIATAGHVIAERIKVGAGTGTWLRRQMSIIPIRVI